MPTWTRNSHLLLKISPVTVLRTFGKSDFVAFYKRGQSYGLAAITLTNFWGKILRGSGKGIYRNNYFAGWCVDEPRFTKSLRFRKSVRQPVQSVCHQVQQQKEIRKNQKKSVRSVCHQVQQQKEIRKKSEKIRPIRVPLDLSPYRFHGIHLRGLPRRNETRKHARNDG